MDYKLGKKPAVNDERDLKLAKYLIPTSLPIPPTAFDRSTAPAGGWGMMANDVHGDCTCAALGHLTQVWTGQTPSDQEVLALYALVNDGVDDGADMNTVLMAFHKHPFTFGKGVVPEKAHSFVRLQGKLNGGENFSDDEIKISMCLFEGVYLGVALPLTAQAQVGSLWDVPTTDTPESKPGSWGGHAINIVAYDPNGLTVVTWGQLQRMTWNFLATYADEAFAVLPSSFTKNPPAGFNMRQLEADLKVI